MFFYLVEMAEFQKIVTGFVTVIDDISKQVEQEKIKVQLQ